MTLYWGKVMSDFLDKFEIYKECVPKCKDQIDFENAIKDFSFFIENYVTNNPYVDNDSFIRKLTDSKEFIMAKNSFRKFVGIYQQNILQKYGKIDEYDFYSLPFLRLIIIGSVERYSKTHYKGLEKLIWVCMLPY